MQIIFATGVRYWEPTGLMTWFTLFFGSLGAWLLSDSARIPRTVKLRLWCVLPVLMAAGCVWTVIVEKWSLWGYDTRNFYAELAVAYLVSWAFGAGYLISAWRSKNVVCRIASVVSASMLLVLLYPAWRYWVHIKAWGNGT
jgi:hypothetical protein